MLETLFEKTWRSMSEPWRVAGNVEPIRRGLNCASNLIMQACRQRHVAGEGRGVRVAPSYRFRAWT